MSITAKIILDSISPAGVRLTSFELCYPRFIHSELMTHRAFSRNAASSRAIPIETMLRRIEANPAAPVFWAANQKGMQAVAEVADITGAQAVWAAACRSAVEHSRQLAACGLHKAIANRVTEPFQHMVTLVTATDWGQFFHLRYHGDAQQEFQVLAQVMYALYRKHTPTDCAVGQWHLPYIRPEDKVEATAEHSTAAASVLRKVSVGRCARTSYVNQDGVRDFADDVALHDRLIKGPVTTGDPGHWSPLEHVAVACDDAHLRSGNFRGWKQYRKEFSNENRLDIPDLLVI